MRTSFAAVFVLATVSVMHCPGGAVDPYDTKHTRQLTCACCATERCGAGTCGSGQDLCPSPVLRDWLQGQAVYIWGPDFIDNDTNGVFTSADTRIHRFSYCVTAGSNRWEGIIQVFKNETPAPSVPQWREDGPYKNILGPARGLIRRETVAAASGKLVVTEAGITIAKRFLDNHVEHILGAGGGSGGCAAGGGGVTSSSSPTIWKYYFGGASAKYDKPWLSLATSSTGQGYTHTKSGNVTTIASTTGDHVEYIVENVDGSGVPASGRHIVGTRDSSGAWHWTVEMVFMTSASDPVAPGMPKFTMSAADLARYFKDNPSAVPDWSNPGASWAIDGLTETELNQYASAKILEYATDTNGIAYPSLVERRDTGCGCGGDSDKGIRRYTRSENTAFQPPATSDPSYKEYIETNWKTAYREERATSAGESLEDRTVTFVNGRGQTMFAVDQRGSAPTVTDTVYDGDGLVRQVRSAEACAGYTLQMQDGWVVGVQRDNSGTEGRVSVTEYDRSFENIPLQRAEKVFRGTGAVPTNDPLVRVYTYTQHVLSVVLVGVPTNLTSHFVASVSEYPSETLDTNASDRVLTRYEYQWYEPQEGSAFTNEHFLKFKKTIRPAVGAPHNGNGTETAGVEHFRVVTASNSVAQHYVDWTRAADGTLTFSLYGENTNQTNEYGKLLCSVQNARTDADGWLVDTELSGYRAPEFEGVRWADTNGIGLKTAYEYDTRGRLFATRHPDGRRSCRVDRAIVSTNGLSIATVSMSVEHMATNGAYNHGAVSIDIRYEDGLRDISVHGLPASSTDGNLFNDLSDSFWLGETALEDGYLGTLLNRTETIRNTAGKVTSTEQWTDPLDPLCEKIVTSHTYDEKGRREYTTQPGGVVTRSVYDNMDRETEIWQGPNTTSLVRISANVYDNYGKLVETRTYFGTNTTDYTATFMNYDWQGRQTATLSPGGIAQVSILDNMDRAITNLTYANATLDSNGVIQVSALNLRAQSATHHDERGQVWKTEQFEVNQTNGTVGASVENLSWFDAAGRQIKSLGPDGLIRKTEYNGLGGARYQFLSTAEGADTDPATIADDTVVSVTENVLDNTKGGRQIAVRQGTSVANLATVSRTWYDSNADGTGTEEFRATGQSVLKASDSTNDFVTTKFLYDAAGRQYGTVSPDPDGAGPLAALETEQVFDSLGRSVSNLTFVSGSPRLLVSAFSSHYTGPRLTETRHYKVVSGTVSDYLPTKYYFDAMGRQCKVEQASGQFQKTVFDLAGQTVAQYLCTDEGSDTNAESVVDDTVVEQTVHTFDSARRPIVTARYQRNDGASGTGDLTTSNARVSWSALWYDDMSRQQTMADYGATNSFTRPETAPAPNSSDDVMVTASAFDGFGRQATVTDNKGIVKKMLYDLAGRLTHTIENYNDFAVAAGEDTNTGDASDTSRDRVIKSVYDPQSRVVQQILLDQNGDGNTNDNQVTRNVYGVDTNCAVAREALLKVIYPDSTNDSDCVSYTYYVNGARKTQTDQRGVVHTYIHDDAGRLVADIVTDLGSSGIVDGSVRRIDYGYDNLGRQTFVRSSVGTDVSSVITNEVAYTYSETAWGQLVKVAQAHDGAADASTPAMQYTWEDGTVAGIAKYVRQSAKIYPNGRVVTNQYTGLDSILSRLSSVADPSVPSVPFVTYSYLGAGTIVELAHPAVAAAGGRGLFLSYGTNGVYPGLDRFGRILDQKWTVGTNVVDRFQYTHDRLGNRVTRAMLPAGGDSLDESYQYDGLQQLTRMDRSNGVNQIWDLEPAGNWAKFTTNGVAETRTHNLFNEITSISSGGTTSVSSVEHDPAGNMTRFPLALRSLGEAGSVVCGPSSVVHSATWDAWNRLIRLADTSGVTIATYAYDGDWKRLKKVVATNTTDYYYDDMQLAETRQIGATGQVVQAESLVYDTRYLHSVACRDIYSGTSHTSLVTRHFFINDGNFNVTALVSTNGDVVERYTYDPYGNVTIRDANWQPVTWDASQKNVCLYTGHKYDAESGLYYSIYRYYHPGLGRWGSRDPLGRVGGDNLYQSVVGNPVGQLDETGLIPFLFASLWKEKNASGVVIHKNGYDEYVTPFAELNERITAEKRSYTDELPKAKNACGDRITYIWSYINALRERVNTPITESEMTTRIVAEKAVLFGTPGEKLTDEKAAVSRELASNHTREWDTSAYFLHTYAGPTLNTIFYRYEQQRRSDVASSMNDIMPPKGNYQGLATCLWREFWRVPPRGRQPGQGLVAFVVEEPEIGFVGSQLTIEVYKNDKKEDCCTVRWEAAQLFVKRVRKSPPRGYSPVL